MGGVVAFQIKTYRGWSITHSELRPVTGRWMAQRHGVRVGSGTLEGVKRVIDLHIEDQLRTAREWRKE